MKRTTITVSIPEELLPDFRIFTVLHGGEIMSADDIINRRIDVNPEYHYVKFNHKGKRFAKKLH